MSAFYAELLPNIRSISLLVSLATPAGHSTHVALNPASASATLHHNANSTSLALPAPANPGPLQLIVKATPGSSALSCRLPLASASPPAPASDNYAPWSAPSLSALSPSSVSFYCRGCGAEVIAPGCINTWKDLPSGNWADMMDFWHCHKPHDDGKKGADQEGVGKYAAFGKGFVVERGTGLVDRGHFLFSSRDCEGAVKVVGVKLQCASCEMLLGAVESGAGEEAQMWRVDKWCLKLAGETASHPLECFLAAQFISLSEEGGVRRLMVTSEEEPDQVNGIKVWIFNTDIRYTHTHAEGSIRGVKVFWMLVKEGESVVTDSLKATGFEGVALGREAFETLRKCLVDSNAALPRDAGRSGEWMVGALRRFEAAGE